MPPSSCGFSTPGKQVRKSRRNRIIFIVKKRDLLPESPAQDGKLLYISAKQGRNIDAVLQEIDSFVKENRIQDATLLTSARHQSLLNGILAAVIRTENGLRNQLPTDLVAEDIRMALHDLGELTGTVSTEDILNNIFGKFCIGK